MCLIKTVTTPTLRDKLDNSNVFIVQKWPKYGPPNTLHIFFQAPRFRLWTAAQQRWLKVQTKSCGFIIIFIIVLQCIFNNLFLHRSRKSHCIRPSGGQAVANSCLGSKGLVTIVIVDDCKVYHNSMSAAVVWFLFRTWLESSGCGSTPIWFSTCVSDTHGTCSWLDPCVLQSCPRLYPQNWNTPNCVNGTCYTAFHHLLPSLTTSSALSHNMVLISVCFYLNILCHSLKQRYPSIFSLFRWIQVIWQN